MYFDLGKKEKKRDSIRKLMYRLILSEGDLQSQV
jgi:hypothetical protein